MAKRLTAFFAAFLILVGSTSAVAQEPQPGFYGSLYLDGCTIGTNADGNRKMTITYRVRGTGVMEKIGVDKVVIEKYVNDDWEYYTSFGSEYTYNAANHVGTVSFHGTANVKYRAIVHAYAGRNGGCSTRAYDGSGVVCKP